MTYNQLVIGHPCGVLVVLTVVALADQRREDGHLRVENGVSGQGTVLAHLFHVVHQQQVAVVAGDGVPLGGVVALNKKAHIKTISWPFPELLPPTPRQ